MTSKLRIAWFSPLNIDPRNRLSSVSAYFSELILPVLRGKFDIDLYHDRFDLYEDYPTFHYLSAFINHKASPYDIFFYQIENASEADFARIHLGLKPGITLFHDLLYSIDTVVSLSNSPWTATRDSFRGGEWSDQNEQYKESKPVALRECTFSLVNLFSNQRWVTEYRTNIQKSLDSGAVDRCFYLPHPIDFNRVVSNPRTNAISRIGFCGSTQIENRVHKLLEALSIVDFETSLIWLLNEEELSQARSIVDEFNYPNCEFVVGRNPIRWQELCEKMDLCFHGHFSVYGQPGVYLAINIAAGIPCLLTDFGESEYVPGELVSKVAAGHNEAPSIANIITTFKNKIDYNFESSLREYSKEHHDRIKVAEELGFVFESNVELSRTFLSKWDLFERSAKSELIDAGKRLMNDDDAWKRIVEPFLSETL